MTDEANHSENLLQFIKSGQVQGEVANKLLCFLAGFITIADNYMNDMPSCPITSRNCDGSNLKSMIFDKSSINKLTEDCLEFCTSLSQSQITYLKHLKEVTDIRLGPLQIKLTTEINGIRDNINEMLLDSIWTVQLRISVVLKNLSPSTPTNELEANMNAVIFCQDISDKRIMVTKLKAVYEKFLPDNNSPEQAKLDQILKIMVGMITKIQ